GEPLDDQFIARFTISNGFVFAATDVPVPIQSYNAFYADLDINQDIFINDLNVTVNITHHSDGDLWFYLLAPFGGYAFLSAFNGAGADFLDTTFDDEAAGPLSAGTSPFAGSFQPDSPLAAFDGMNARGRWQLWVGNYGTQVGSLNSWSITILPDGG